jgi:hypothetical protein
MAIPAPRQSSVCVRDLHLIGVSIMKPEYNSPSTVDIDGPKVSQWTLELMETNTVKLPEIAKRGCGVQLVQSLICGFLLKA